MSIIPMHLTPSLRLLSLVLSAILLAAAGCSKTTANPPKLGAPLFQAFAPEAVTELEVSTRPVSGSAWRVKLTRESKTSWKMVARSDLPGTDLADSAFTEHLLEVLGSFTTEAKSGQGTDAGLGFAPYRTEIRMTVAGKPRRLLLGDPSGLAAIYFRQDDDSETWTGRGALIAFLENLQTPDAFLLKSPYIGRYEDLTEIELEKHEGKDRGRWKISKKDAAWTNTANQIAMSSEQSAVLERIFRNRIMRVSEQAPELPKTPDWTLNIAQTTAAGPTTQVITVFFVLDQIYAKNPARHGQPLELYPEFAGALRSWIQLAPGKP